MARRNRRKVNMPFVIIVSILLSAGILYKLAPYFGIDVPSMQKISSMAGFTSQPAAAAKDNSPFSIHDIDVGQGDSALIKCGNDAMLIDGGTGENTQKVTNYLDSQGIKRLEYVIATHPHEDHIGGLPTVIKRYDIGTVIMSNKTTNTSIYEKFLDAIEAKNIKVNNPVVGIKYTLGDMSFTVYAPEPTVQSDDLNDYSIVIRMEYKGKTFLYTGDATAQTEKDLLESGQDLKADVLKVAHHGSAESTTAAFLKKVSPQYAVISVGIDNSYGHPANSTLKRLQNAGVRILRTDLNGSVVFMVDKDGKLTYRSQK